MTMENGRDAQSSPVDPAAQWNRTEVAFDPDLRLGDLIARALDQHADHVAMKFGPDTLDYRTLKTQVHAVASALASQGIGPGDRVGVCAQRGFGMFQSILGVLVSGAAFVPIEPTLPTGRLREIFEDSRLGLLIGPEADIGLLDPGLGEAMPVQTTESMLLEAGPEVEQPLPVAGHPDDLAYIFFTSGSTGRPKGAMNTHRAVVNRLLWGQSKWPVGAGHRFLQKTAFTFDVSVWEYLWPLTQGAMLVIARPDGHRDPAYLVRTIRDERITVTAFVPSMLRMFLEVAEVTQCVDLAHVVAAGEALPADTVARFQSLLPRARLFNQYGPTETAIEVTFFECDPRQPRNPVPIGQPVANTRIYVLDPEGSPVPVGETGEICIAGVQVGPGYFGRPDLSAERFLPDPFVRGARMYRSGDLGRWTPDGLIECLGRLDFQVKLRGNRIELEEIEARLRAHPGVSDCVAGVVEDPIGEARLVAWVVGRGDESVSDDALLAFAAQSLPDYMVPEFLRWLPTLPLLSSGKTDRKALPSPDFGFALQKSPGESSRLPSSQTIADPATARELVATLWRELLGKPDLDADTNLFDAGARSVLVMGFISRLQAAGVQAIGVGDVYDRPSIRALQDRVTQAPTDAGVDGHRTRGRGPVAIVGMALRAPGANDVDAFWDLLVEGRSGIRRFSPEEIDPGVPESLRTRPNFVPCKGIVEDAEHFDAGYFGIAPREATLIDPQQRLLLELSVQALEHAGIDPERCPDVGVYAGTATASYLTALRQHAASLVQQSGEFATTVANDKDYVATRIAHRVGLRGPAIAIHTACSTGLVATAMAVESLRSGQCDVALAGGATVIVPQRSGHLHVEGGMESGDGHCRPFEARASGTVFSGGAGLVVLKRLEDALADGDTVYAVIDGIGVNNDGGHKASFTAPSVDGQARAIRRALADAGCRGDQIGYMEAHGTGTPLGDPIEVSGLVAAWERDGGENGRCALGSIKANIGHTIAAAGVLGLIRCALSLHRELIPALPDFDQPNPQIDFANTPFRISRSNEPWPRANTPRRAAVSSFGVGGTNAHVVMSEAPDAAMRPVEAGSTGPWILPLSAADADALQRSQGELSRYLRTRPETSLDDVVHTLVRGRQARRWRSVVSGADRDEVLARLDAGPVAVQANARPRTVLLFPGQGSQHPGMAAGLHGRFPEFAAAFDEAWSAIAPHVAIDLRALLLERGEGEDGAKLLSQTRHAQPALFLMGYALARWLGAHGLEPAAMIGHSIGEYAAIAAAGLLPVGDVAACVCARGAAMQAQPNGSMLAVRSDASTLAPLLPDAVEVAACNAPTLTVLSGPDEAVDAVQADLQAREMQCTRLRVSHAFHSRSMDGALDAVRQAWQGLHARTGTCPVYSCVSGGELSLETAGDPDYWARQVRQPVRFSAALQRELAQSDTVFVEVGPGQALTALVRAHREPGAAPPVCVPLLPQPNAPVDPSVHLLGALGQLWARGAPLELPVPAGSRRATLPVYPFQGPRFWFETAPAAQPPVESGASPVAAPQPTMSTQPSSLQETPLASRLERIQSEVLQLIANVSGLAPEDLRADVPFVAQGLDSLSVTQAALELNRVFDSSFGIRDLMERLDTAAAIAGQLDEQLPADRFRPEPAPAPATAVSPTSSPGPEATTPIDPVPLPAAPTTAPGAGAAATSAVAPDAVHSLIRTHLAMIEQLLALLPGQQSQLAPPTLAQQLPAAQIAPAGESAPAPQPLIDANEVGSDAAEAATAPLAPGQSERWLAASLHENGLRALNESVCLELQGPLDVEAMSRAADAIARRHQAFSTAFSTDQPKQEIQPSSHLALEMVDVSGHEDPERAASEACDDAASTRFSMEHAPLARLLLVRLSDRAHRLLMVASHLVFDGWSSSVFVDEIAEAYLAQVQSRPMRLAAAESPLAFARAEQARVGTPQAVADIEWWKGHLSALPAPLALGDLDPGDGRGFGADTIRCIVQGPRLDRLKTMCREAGATLFQGTLASLACALGGVTGASRLAIGIPYAGQLGGAHPALITDGVYDLPLLVDLGGHTEPAKVVGPLRKTLLEAMEHARVTQGQVARALGVTAAGMRPPITGIYFNFNPRVKLPTLGDVHTDIHEARKGGLLGEAFFNFYDQGDRLRLELHYSTDFYSRERAQALVDAMMRVLDGGSVDAHAPMHRSSEVPAPESPTAPVVVEGPVLSLPPDQRVDELVLGHLSPDQKITCRDGRHDGRQLRAAVEALASTLRSHGIGRGHRVGINLPRNFWMLVAPLAVMRAGACYVPMDPLFPEARLAMIAEDAALDLLLTTEPQARWAEGTPTLDPTGVRIDTLALHDAVPVHHSIDNAEEPAYVIYTSGSTGRPKGVALSHRSVINFLLAMRECPGLSASDTLAALTTFSFDIAVLELYLPLITGASLVILDTTEPLEIADALEREKVTVMQATPPSWTGLVGEGWRGSPGFRVLVGGEALAPDLARQLLERAGEVWNMYGPTETTVWSTTWRVHAPESGIRVGRPVANTRIVLLDDQLQPCAPGQPGEICIGGAGVALGYVDRPELTAERFIPDPCDPASDTRFYRTGDLGRWNDDGNLEHLGRTDFQIKIRGYRVEPGEIEVRLREHPDVDQAVVIAREFATDDIRLVAYVTPTPGRTPDVAAVRRFLAEWLPTYMRPQHIAVLSELPHTPNGKIDRQALPNPIGLASLAGDPSKTEVDDNLELVVELAREMLGDPQVTGEDNFFDAGGHSLLALSLMLRIREKTGHRIHLLRLANSSLAAVASDLSAAASNASAEVGIVGRVRRMFGQKDQGAAEK